MNIYLVSRTDEVDYDEYDAVVVYAMSREEAKNIAPCGNLYTWASKENLKVELIGSNVLVKDPDIILSSYNAG